MACSELAWDDTFRFEKGSSFSSIAPSLGQHTREIMLDNGYSIDKINKLINDGVIK